MGILLIACVEDRIEPVVAGIREFPVSKLVMITDKKHLDTCREIESKVFFLKIDIETREVGGNLIKEYLEAVSQIAADNALEYDDVYINIGGGGRYTSCAALSAAFVNGVKAFDVMGDRVIPLPVLKFSYCDLISDAKLRILKTLDKAGGTMDSLHQLSETSGIEKSLLSYHIRGTRESKGLEELGLVEVGRKTRGKLKIELTTMGRLMLIGRE